MNNVKIWATRTHWNVFEGLPDHVDCQRAVIQVYFLWTRNIWHLAVFQALLAEF